MKEKKYIIVECEGCLEYPVLFNELVQHVKEAGGRKVVGAGFFNAKTVWDSDIEEITGVEVEAFGESNSLSIKSRGAVDAEIIRKFLFD